MPIITLTTDFGTRDGYVGAVKGVLANQGVIDISHDVPPGDIAHAAWVVATSTLEFPAGTIHLVVVDPGVGGARSGVIVRAGAQWYVGPDNGVFSYVVDAARDVCAVEIAPRAPEGWRLGQRIPPLEITQPVRIPTSRTFHARDVFAPVAVRLARETDTDEPQTVLARFGAPVVLTGELPWGPRPHREGRVVHIDHFGNLITDLPPAEAGEAITIAGRTLRVVGTYEDVAPGELLAYLGSARTIEVAVRDGRAADRLDAPRGTPVVTALSTGPYR